MLTHLPLPQPLVVTSPFGILRSDGKVHRGVDLRAPVGTPTFAVSGARVARIGEDNVSGKYVVLDLDDGREAVYVHLSRVDVAKGQDVAGGQQIGLTGATGRVSGPHLHLEIQTPGIVRSETDPMTEIQAIINRGEGARAGSNGGAVLVVAYALARASGWMP